MTEVFWGKENVLYLDRSWGYTGVHLHVSATSLYVHFVPKEKKFVKKLAKKLRGSW